MIDDSKEHVCETTRDYIIPAGTKVRSVTSRKVTARGLAKAANIVVTVVLTILVVLLVVLVVSHG